MLTALFLLMLGAQTAGAGSLSPGLERMFEDMDDLEMVKVLVVMEDRADIQTLDKSLNFQKASLAVRHQRVVSSLRETATRSQKDLIASLSSDKSAGGILGFTPHWLVNSVVVTATVARVRVLAQRDDVLTIEPDLEVQPVEPIMTKNAVRPMDKGADGILTPGLVAINANRVWHELGIDGTGALVANLDSGVDVTHPGLASRWRGNFTTSAEAWRDHGNVGSPDLPYDVMGHGTHVMGTITGVTDFDTVGVAPGAQWMASNALATSEGFDGLDNAILAAFEWFADPDGDPTTHHDVPDVVQNSWGVGPNLGPYIECYSLWWEVIDNCEAAGVVVLFSAGNDGPGPGTIKSPGDRADSPTNCFTVGSTYTMPPFNTSHFSSRGPSDCGGPYAIKPEVMAPGHDILSLVPGNGMAYMSGTSMAGPHVAGVVALMRQANPNVDVTTIKEILMETAVDLDTAGEDNITGHGLVDAYAAVLAVMNDVGTVTGVVSDANTGLPLAGVKVRDVNRSGEKMTAADGIYTFTMRAGESTFGVTKYGYEDGLVVVDIPVGDLVTKDISLVPSPWSRISGLVTGPDDLPLGEATITALNTPLDPVVSASDGSFELFLPSGDHMTYDLLAEAPGLAYDLGHVGLQGDVVVDFHLPEIGFDGFESGEFNTYPWEFLGSASWTIVDEEAHEGILSARSGDIGDSQETELALDYYANGGGDLSFWYMVESETVYDKLTFHVDDVVFGPWSDQVAWTQFTTYLEPGLHRLRWVYSKDVTATVLRDAVWIDEVRFPGTGARPFPSIGLGQTLCQENIDAGAVVTFPLTIGNAGGFQLDYTVEVIDMATGLHPNWATVPSDTGTVYPGNDNIIELECDGFMAGTGLSTALLTLHSNDPDHPDTTVTFELNVNAVSGVDGGIPDRINLHGAIPNPFNPMTDIHFALPTASRVSLLVFDVSGRLIRNLMTEDLAMGEYRIAWNGKDEDGRDVASGVYYARLKVAGDSLIKPMTLIR
jgi:subtilisin family serine protease